VSCVVSGGVVVAALSSSAVGGDRGTSMKTGSSVAPSGGVGLGGGHRLTAMGLEAGWGTVSITVVIVGSIVVISGVVQVGSSFGSWAFAFRVGPVIWGLVRSQERGLGRAGGPRAEQVLALVVVAVFIVILSSLLRGSGKAGGMALQGLGGVSVAESGAIVSSLSMGGFVVRVCVVWGGVLLCGVVWSVVLVRGSCCGIGMVVVVWLLNSWIIARMLSFKAWISFKV